ASIADYYPHTIVISGLSKSLSMTGWRVGWLFAEDEVVRAALILHGYVTTCASTVSQKASLAAWTTEAEEARRAARLTFRERRDYLLKLLADEAGLEAVRPDGAFYTMVKTGGIASSMKVAEAALSQGVITVPGSAFGIEGEGFLRVSFCANHDVLAEGVSRLAEALQSLRRD
ncbi:MAG TPA: aminotransferase class I/II-fold pyridoxal phosphate-dependent enzyme, partial [Pyrinomonadaceae bacterium]|nr:aminotransferase class I/II-fold pyridoxal phosphate-dependent enzyme [Pyrinomonadaceae bacterium]